jgi:hypothetical protein
MQLTVNLVGTYDNPKLYEGSSNKDEARRNSHVGQSERR